MEFDVKYDALLDMMETELLCVKTLYDEHMQVPQGEGGGGVLCVKTLYDEHIQVPGGCL